MEPRRIAAALRHSARGCGILPAQVRHATRVPRDRNKSQEIDMTKATHLTAADLQRFRTTLAHKRDTLVAAQKEGEAGRRGLNDLESEDGDLAEQVIEQDAALNVGAFDAALLADVDRALAKLDAGTYGVSEKTGDPIPRERLEAIPWARNNVDE
jgi:RNA polymerase-binding transcription factor DksA